ncbi:hypothetical protein CZ771_06595 [Actinomycetales bacterium JB111]|nr:hypothetical protein CZ771_06595 [Actinomycetales bacterium JB111]
MMHTCPRPGGRGRGTRRFLLADEDTERIGAIHVTTRARTVFDVIRSGEQADIGVARALLRGPLLAGTGGGRAPLARTARVVAQVEAICDRGMPGSTRVRRVLDLLAASIE